MPFSGKHFPTKQLGRRGASLLVWGGMWFLAGLPLLFYTPPSELHIAALRLWAAGFVAAGILALIAAFRGHPRGDRFGFLALTLVASLFIVYSLILFALTLVDHGGFTTALPPLLNAVQDTLLVVKVNIDAGWPEPTQPIDLTELLDGDHHDS